MLVTIISLTLIASYCSNRGGGSEKEDGEGSSSGCSNTSGLTASSSTSTSHNAGQACLSCHKSGGTASAYIFTVGGTVYTSATGTVDTTKAGQSVLLNTGVTVTVDSCGNFFSKNAVSFFNNGAGVKVGAGTAMGDQGTPISGDCNSSGCHGATDNRRIY